MSPGPLRWTGLIIARDEAAHIRACVEAARAVADEVLVVDTGSTDGTPDLARAAGARVLTTPWLGYGATKNWGAARARHDWIVSLDADEAPDPALATALRALRPRTGEVYGLHRITNYCGHWVRYGSWSRDIVWRVYDRRAARWTEAAVHERLEQPGARRQVLTGRLLHYSYPTPASHARKLEAYARLGADELFARGVRPRWRQRYLSPPWRAFRGYVLRGGWRDGWAGRAVARADYRVARLKYEALAARWADTTADG